MEKKEADPGVSEKKFAAVCGLYCAACSWFIAATEGPARLKRLAAGMGFSEEESRCEGCRGEKRLPYCDQCKIWSCADKRGIDFCIQCEAYPCDELKRFQAAMPHRIELWANLERIASVGHAQWLKEIRRRYACPRCGTLNSAYDLKCRECGTEPSCRYVADHREEIEGYLQNR